MKFSELVYIGLLIIAVYEILDIGAALLKSWEFETAQIALVLAVLSPLLLLIMLADWLIDLLGGEPE